MKINTLLIAKEKLISFFNFDELISIYDVGKLYKILEQIINNCPEIQQYMAEQQHKYEQIISNKSKNIRIFLLYIDILSQLYNIQFKNNLYDIDFFEYIVSNFNCIQHSDKSYTQYDTLLEYIMNLLKDVSNSYKKQDFENKSEFFVKDNSNLSKIDYQDFENINDNFNKNFNSIYEELKNTYNYYVYYINKKQLNKINGATLSLFLLPLKYIVQDLLVFLNEIINKDENIIDEKISKFVNDYGLNDTEANVFRIRCKNLDYSNNEIAKALSLSVASVEMAINNIMPHLKEYLNISDNNQKKFKTLIKSFLK